MIYICDHKCGITADTPDELQTAASWDQQAEGDLSLIRVSVPVLKHLHPAHLIYTGMHERTAAGCWHPQGSKVTV